MITAFTVRRRMITGFKHIARRAAGLSAGIAAALVLAAPAAAQDDAPDQMRETFRDWVVSCQRMPDDAAADAGQRVCELFQRLDQRESGQRVLNFSLRIDDEGAPVAVVVAPFGLRLSEGLRVQIGDEQVAHFAFDTCLPQGCVVIAPVDDELIAAMQAGSEATVVLVSRQGEALGLPLSLMGFSSGLARLRALSDA